MTVWLRILASSSVPALRASNVDPAIAMRAD